MREKIDQLISHVQSSLYLLNEACNEIWHITQTPNTKEEYDIVSGHPFSFYGVALQYCFIMEYAKLLDSNSSKEDENVASLYRLNNCVNEFLGEEYQTKYLENKKLLNEISKSELCIRLKKLRNKKFGHADNDSINNPLKIEGFTGEQIVQIKDQLRLILKIANNSIIAATKASFMLNDDSRTANFIRYHAKYKQYYFKNFIKAAEEGYGLHREVE